MANWTLDLLQAMAFAPGFEHGDATPQHIVEIGAPVLHHFVETAEFVAEL